ncbi:3396_t:CDS:2 [Paraglomus brasilianum]|uniref:3396_t:CDS:1 n=1 Tax=Paraglomus brasilianum TaxID=144538 RepID=A0A9N9FIZ9_9GLOM|nr:3396_t:CDS:2 [Paraglomus brasilianum]
MFLNAVGLLGVVYSFNWNQAPIEACYFQALATQFAAFVTASAGLNFTIQTYRLLVLYKRRDLTHSRLRYYYYGFLIIYPIVGTIIVSVVAIMEKAVKPRLYHCDIVSPIWVRLVSYNGANLLLSIPGTYFSARAAIAVYRHTGQFKSTKLSANDVTNSQGSTDSLAMTAEALGSRVNILDAEKHSHVQLPKLTLDSKSTYARRNTEPSINLSTSNNSYGITRSAAIRMVVFTVAYAITNLAASVGIILDVIANKPLPPNPGGSDFVGSSLGIPLLLIFGTSSEIRQWTRDKLKSLFASKN